MRTIRTAIIGTRFMGRAHAAGIDDLNRFFDPGVKVEKAVLCGTDEEHTAVMAERLGFQEASTDFKAILLRDDIDAIHICTPVFEHFNQGMSSAVVKKHLFIEKPLCMTAQEAETLAYTAKENGIVHQVGLNYRFVPAVRMAKALIEKGMIGDLYHFRGVYAQDKCDPESPMSWRYDKEKAGAGAISDIGTHISDLALYLMGDITSVSATLKTFVNKRPVQDSEGKLTGEYAPVTVDDAFISQVEFACGAIGTIEATRFATGNRNALSFEINGSKGSLRFNLLRLNELEFFDNTQPQVLQGWRTIQCTDATHPYGGKWWPVGHQLGWANTFAHEFNTFYKAIAKGTSSSPDFGDGARVARFLEAAENSYYSQTTEILSPIEE